MQQEPRAIRRGPLPSAGPAVTVADRWVAQLRRQAKESTAGTSPSPRASAPEEFLGSETVVGASGAGATNGRSGGPRRQQRPPSSSTSLRPLSSNPSLFSLESGAPTSPTTTASTGAWPTSSAPPPPHRHSVSPHSPSRTSVPSRSHTSLPPSSTHRHRDQLDRVYGERNRYDAEFDRGFGASPRPSTSSQPPAAKLYNPDSAPRRRAPDDQSTSSSRHPRSKREAVDPADVGSKKDSKESLESADEPDAAPNGRTGSRSSKESKRSKRREDRRRAEDGETGAPPVARGLFNPRTDNPLKYGTGTSAAGSARKGAGASDTRSFISSNISSTSSVVSGSDAPNRTDDAAAVNRSDPTPFVTELKRILQDIIKLEKRLQDDHRAALAASAREDDVGAGVRIQGGTKKYDDAYWVKLATAHKQLADSHYSFLQVAFNPRHPASLQTLPKKYNIPSRLWQTGFHQLLERMRHAVAAPPSEGQTNVLEHLVEFIQYAYGFYTQLYEENELVSFRPLWIEQLGDLSRYRMAVAGLASRVSAAAQAHTPASLALAARVSDEGRARPVDAASIGEAALGDWELEEQETWKTMARDWYSQGVKEVPGNGRLQHHLALLSKGDELRSLYHYSKSLTTTHPYTSARESILPLFEDELQARRTQPDVTKAELFVHLHGMLFTKISLDDFEPCFERFIERLSEEALLAARPGSSWATLGTSPFGDAEWFMIGVINISALLQYGAEDSVLKRSMTKEGAVATPNGITARKPRTPQAIMLNPSSLKRAESVHDDDDGSLSADSAAAEVVMQLSATSEDPLAFRLAQRLTFGLLDILLQHPVRVVGEARVANPYIVLILTFLGHIFQHPATLRHLERAIPWARLVVFLNKLPTTADIRTDGGPAKLIGSPLPEDWCIRGMDWTGRHLFSRGYWKGAEVTAAGGQPGEMPPPIVPPSSATIESEMDALKIDLDDLDEIPTEGDVESATAQLASARWHRLASVASWLVNAVPGLDFDISSGSRKFAIAGGLETKLRRWKQEDDEMAEAEKQSRMSAWGDDAAEDDQEDSEESDEEDDDPTDSPTVRDLKARRRELKAVIKQARQATRRPPLPIRRMSAPKHKTHLGRPTLSVFPGYTVLVFDTNILLTSMKLFQDLLEAETWTIIVPLAVVTELDGLRNNPAPLGTSAEAAVAYLETAIQSYPRYLKVQTSRGNYLKDLSIRNEAIDFAGSAANAGGFSHDFARSMDDVILRAVAWQKDHFTSRLALVNPKVDRRQVPPDASTVVLITFDRNLRLKARARGLDAADEKGMSALLGKGNG